jgi:hypothetical protein
VLLDKVEGNDRLATGDLRAGLQTLAAHLHARRFEPYPACGVVCTQTPKVCMYRSAVADLVRTGRYREAWQDAGRLDDQSDDDRPRQTWSVLQDAAYELIEFPSAEEPAEVRAHMEGAFRRVAMCFEQQMLAGDPSKVPRTARKVLANVLYEAGL